MKWVFKIGQVFLLGEFDLKHVVFMTRPIGVKTKDLQKKLADDNLKLHCIPSKHFGIFVKMTQCIL